MSKIKIITDSTADLPENLAEEYEIGFIPLKVVWPDGKVEDDSWVPREIEDFYERISKTQKLPKTSQPSPADFEKLFKDYIDKSYEEIIVLCISTALSGTYNSALIAAKSFDIPIHVIDTKVASSAAGLLALKAARLTKKGLASKEIVKIISEDIKKRNFHAAFYVSNFDFLVKGGRVSKLQGFLGGMLRLKVGIFINENGELVPFNKVRGTKRAIEMISSKIGNLIPKGSKLRVMPVSAAAPKEAENIAAKLSEKYEIEILQTAMMGKVITTHVGPGTAGVGIEIVS